MSVKQLSEFEKLNVNCQFAKLQTDYPMIFVINLLKAWLDVVKL